jgi:hypothetical protein
LFDYVATSISFGSVFGYSRVSDRVVQYSIELTEGKFRPVIQLSETQVFETKPISPGYWKFTWEAGHGSWAWIDETVRFDPARQLFAEKRTVRPYPGFAQAHCDLSIDSLADLWTAVGQVVPDFGEANIRDLRGLIDKTRPNSFTATDVVMKYQGEQVPLQLEWLINDSRRIGIQFMGESTLVAAIQLQANAWCSAQ